MFAKVWQKSVLMHGSMRACVPSLSVDVQLDWLGSAVICVKAVAVLLLREPRHSMYRSSDTLALLAMFAALGLTALRAPAWCALKAACIWA